MNIDTFEIKPPDDLTEAEKASGKWEPVPDFLVNEATEYHNRLEKPGRNTRLARWAMHKRKKARQRVKNKIAKRSRKQNRRL